MPPKSEILSGGIFYVINTYFFAALITCVFNLMYSLFLSAVATSRPFVAVSIAPFLSPAFN
jgi:hypothetical protein